MSHPRVLDRAQSVLVVIDVQEAYRGITVEPERMLRGVRRLIEAAKLVGVPILATEQYPRGLGHTVPELAAYPSATLAKTAFSAAAAPGFDGLIPAGTREIIVAGCEAHVCVLQTVLGLLGSRLRVILAADATGSRDPADKALAVHRARQHGAEVVSTEMVLFEWLRDASHPAFRSVQKLLK